MVCSCIARKSALQYSSLTLAQCGRPLVLARSGQAVASALKKAQDLPYCDRAGTRKCVCNMAERRALLPLAGLIDHRNWQRHGDTYAGNASGERPSDFFTKHKLRNGERSGPDWRAYSKVT